MGGIVNIHQRYISMKRLDGCTSSWSGANLNIKNLDVVDLEAVNIYCSSINIDGEQIDVRPLKHITEDETSTTIGSDLSITGTTAATDITCTGILVNGKNLESEVSSVSNQVQYISSSELDNTTTIDHKTIVNELEAQQITTDTLLFRGVGNVHMPCIRVWETFGDLHTCMTNTNIFESPNIEEVQPLEATGTLWVNNRYHVPQTGLYRVSLCFQGIGSVNYLEGVRVLLNITSEVSPNVGTFDIVPSPSGVLQITSSTETVVSYTTLTNLLKDSTVYVHAYSNTTFQLLGITWADFTIEYVSA